MPESPGPKSAQLLPLASLHAALLKRHAEAKSFEDRDTYIGGSEVGSCLRLVVWRKLHPDHPWEPDAAGRMRAGQVLENEAVQMVRGALGNAVRETGAAQVEFSLPDAPIRVHPDGRLLRSAFAELLGSGLRIVVRRKDGSNGYLEELPPGDGTLEIKTGGTWVVSALARGKELSLPHQGQTQVEMGGQCTLWGLLVMVSRENLSQAEAVFLEFDPDEFAAMKTRARVAMTALDKIKQGILSDPEGLPEPEEERGYCQKCPIIDSCPIFIAKRAAAPEGSDGTVIPPERVPDLEAIVEELLALKPDANRYEDIKEWLKDEVQIMHLTKAALPSGIILEVSPRKGRITYDPQKLKAFPDAEAAARKEGDPFIVLNIKEPRL